MVPKFSILSYMELFQSEGWDSARICQILWTLPDNYKHFGKDRAWVCTMNLWNKMTLYIIEKIIKAWEVLEGCQPSLKILVGLVVIVVVTFLMDLWIIINVIYLQTKPAKSIFALVHETPPPENTALLEHCLPKTPPPGTLPPERPKHRQHFSYTPTVCLNIVAYTGRCCCRQCCYCCWLV